MRGMMRFIGVALGVMGLSGGWAKACPTCHQTPCVKVVEPAYECVTELVPYTVMKQRVRVERVPVQETVMVKEPITQLVERQRVVCRPVYETSYVQRQRVVCRPVYDTTYVTQQEVVCRPVQETRLVSECVMEPYTRTMVVPAYARTGGCGLGLLCGKRHHGRCGGLTPAGCVEVVQTCYRPTVVSREVVETRMVQEVVTRQVPVRTMRMVQEVVTENVPVTHCRMVREVVVDRVPVVCGYRCVPKVVTRYVKRKVCETVPVTRYKKVKRMVPVCATPVGVGPMIAAAALGSLPSEQAAPSSQALPPSEQH
ncbi:MAG: hypothetical protein KatS3mg108_3564 [Isosphaeraceae bacterium]|jgi:hypothetical protein|nr:MAG: hypothetical protein KatS3mg108_3564 [Isosphaeraceae bacterium]